MKPPRFAEGRLLVVVPDDPVTARRVAALLLEAGYTAVCWVTGEAELQEATAEFQPDVILREHGADWARPPSADGGAAPRVLPFRAASGLAGRPEHAGPALLPLVDAEDLLARIDWALELGQCSRHLHEERALFEAKQREHRHELEEAQLRMLERMTLVAESRDDQTGRHIGRVGQLSAILARELRLPTEQVLALRRTAPLHDIGKIGIPDHILLKPGKLTREEFAQVREHPLVGARILAGSTLPVLQQAAEIALTHHENWNGRGYPRGLRAEEIPIAGRIVALADVWDALSHVRPYKRALTPAEALKVLRRERGRRLDPEVLAVFVALAPSLFPTTAGR
jgi:putative two-component system response regulator